MKNKHPKIWLFQIFCLILHPDNKCIRRMIIPIKDLKVMVLSFPADDYCRRELMNKTDEELIEIATKSPKCKVWGDLEVFQNCLNDDFIDTENNWIFFASQQVEYEPPVACG